MISSRPVPRAFLLQGSERTLATVSWSAEGALNGPLLTVNPVAQAMCAVAATEIRQLVESTTPQRPQWIVPQAVLTPFLIGGGAALVALSSRFSSTAGSGGDGDNTPSPRVAVQIWGATTIAFGAWAGLDALSASRQSGERVVSETRLPVRGVPVPCPAGTPVPASGELVFVTPAGTALLGQVQPGTPASFDLSPLFAPDVPRIGDVGQLEIAGQPVEDLDLRPLREFIARRDQPPLPQLPLPQPAPAPQPDDRDSTPAPPPTEHQFDARGTDEALKRLGLALLGTVAGEQLRRDGAEDGGFGGYLKKEIGSAVRDKSIDYGLRAVLPHASAAQVKLVRKLLTNLLENKNPVDSVLKDYIADQLRNGFDDSDVRDIADFLLRLKEKFGSK